ncbi:hypothetical protein A3D77_03965 [Candidatus Gottesmanbacteria bacterium RIFCSPHIGHO2_02_FULL_39_11]|uniref:Uncharacterized protein n=1 Tax=Candidatus Gottesmanbacteria bacterium RIFCSPHIGHO2_02_FULL_39_11 TaxID=1798382 RepID=A0A1F5ZJH4_9BACT|nr:MAG: hypothetical protein A3D77_03965 [Candidatus Gottesmanbacteria bacterium RIFCSPHIGHO2_02_FULL_39_11]
MDILIFIIGIMQFIFFVSLQCIFFRFIDTRRVMKWISLFFIFSFICINVLYAFIGFKLNLFSVWIVLLSGIIYGLLAQIYILAVFGVIESSIRIRVLSEIVSYGLKGVSYKNLLKKYNKKIIIDKRLGRFVQSGELIYDENYYKRGSMKTFSYIPAFIFSLYWKLYRSF